MVLYRKAGMLTMLPLPPLGIIELPFGGKNDKIKSLSITPNPVTTHAHMDFDLGTPSNAILTVMDICGRKVYESKAEHYSHGTHQIEWECGNLRNGIYTCRLNAGQEIFTGKMIILQNK
jgi:hypothetical protein